MITLGLTAALDEGIHKKILGLNMTTLTISNNEVEDEMEIVKSLENKVSLNKTIENETKEQKGGFLIRCIRC